MDPISFLPQIIVPIVGLVCSRAALAIAHAHNWYPEWQVADFVMTEKHRVRMSFLRLRRILRRPPHLPNAVGVKWIPIGQGWEARWQADPELIGRGYLPKSARLWRGSTWELEKGLSAPDFICHRATALQLEMYHWKRDNFFRRAA